MIQPTFEQTFEGWRAAARDCLLKGLAPNDVSWDPNNLIFDLDEPFKAKPPGASATVPVEYLKLAEPVAYARDPDRWDLLYRLLYRLQYENHSLMQLIVDADVLRATHLAKSVRRDIHKMHAFVRFKKIIREGQEAYVAWHKPEHYSVRLGTPFFVRRFGDRPWSVFTPDQSAHWDLKELTFGPGLPQHEFEARDDWDEIWRTYYKSIFNPARIKIKMMKREMAPKYWSSMPETALIKDLVRQAPQRLQIMASEHRQSAKVDTSLSMAGLKSAAQICSACPLYQHATQTVFGEGSERADIMIVGEQPGDHEDQVGKPFVGPSGDILDEALRQAGLERQALYITNAVKHFKWIPKGKVRLHQKPTGQEMHACMPWLEAEIARVKPRVIVALGATAATAILGRLPKIGKERGQVITNLKIASKVIVSWHPSAILRAFSDNEGVERRAQLAADLQLAKASV